MRGRADVAVLGVAGWSVRGCLPRGSAGDRGAARRDHDRGVLDGAGGVLAVAAVGGGMASVVPAHRRRRSCEPRTHGPVA